MGVGRDPQKSSKRYRWGKQSCPFPVWNHVGLPYLEQVGCVGVEWCKDMPISFDSLLRFASHGHSICLPLIFIFIHSFMHATKLYLDRPILNPTRKQLSFFFLDRWKPIIFIVHVILMCMWSMCSINEYLSSNSNYIFNNMDETLRKSFSKWEIDRRLCFL